MLASGARGQRFESSRAYQLVSHLPALTPSISIRIQLCSKSRKALAPRFLGLRRPRVSGRLQILTFNTDSPTETSDSIFLDGITESHSAAAPNATAPVKSKARTHPKCSAIRGVKVGDITPPRLLPVFSKPPTKPSFLAEI